MKERVKLTFFVPIYIRKNFLSNRNLLKILYISQVNIFWFLEYWYILNKSFVYFTPLNMLAWNFFHLTQIIEQIYDINLTIISLRSRFLVQSKQFHDAKISSYLISNPGRTHFDKVLWTKMHFMFTKCMNSSSSYIM